MDSAIKVVEAVGVFGGWAFLVCALALWMMVYGLSKAEEYQASEDD